MTNIDGGGSGRMDLLVIPSSHIFFYGQRYSISFSPPASSANPNSGALLKKLKESQEGHIPIAVIFLTKNRNSFDLASLGVVALVLNIKKTHDNSEIYIIQIQIVGRCSFYNERDDTGLRISLKDGVLFADADILPVPNMTQEEWHDQHTRRAVEEVVDLLAEAHLRYQEMMDRGLKYSDIHPMMIAINTALILAADPKKIANLDDFLRIMCIWLDKACEIFLYLGQEFLSANTGEDLIEMLATFAVDVLELLADYDPDFYPALPLKDDGDPEDDQNSPRDPDKKKKGGNNFPSKGELKTAAPKGKITPETLIKQINAVVERLIRLKKIIGYPEEGRGD